MSDNNYKAQLAAEFNEFYHRITSPNVSQIGNYRIVEEIGEGAFGKVYLAVHVLLDIKVVLKCGLIDDPNIVREIYYHRQLKHKNIVNLYEVVKTENHLWIVLEYCEGSELFFYIYEKKRLELRECQHLFFQIVLGLKYVHSLNLSHRDLKLENILLADRKKTLVKLTDFGFVREFNPQNRKLLSTVCGTTVYMAPELLKGMKYSGFNTDIWSLGVILFTMLYGEMPFDEDDDMKTKYKIINEEPVYKPFIPTDVQNLIRRMLSKDPSTRPNLNDILNSSFLVDLYNKHLDKTSRHSYNDAESVLSINQHYHVTNTPFQTKIEKDLLRRLRLLNYNVDELQNNVFHNEMNSLTAFYELLLTKEFSKKKKRYYKEKKRKYEEAKSSLAKSRNKVKSVLSLSDLSGTQPLDKIKSTLSTHRNTSKANLTRLNSDSRKSTDTDHVPNRKMDSQLSRNSFYNNKSALQTDPYFKESPKALKAAGPSINGSMQESPSFSRLVSFYPEEAIRRTSLASSNDSAKKKTNLLQKLKFWKKEKDIQDSMGSLQLNDAANEQSASTTLLNDDDLEPPLELKIGDQMTPKEEVKEEPKPASSPVATISNKNDKVFFDEKTLGGSPMISDNGSRNTRPRPTSMISQISQLSHLSQMSTMISESEIENLDETDTMEDYYEDEDLYESSLNASQDFSKLTIPNPSTTTAQKAAKLKRPGYKRTLSSDMSNQSSPVVSSNKSQKRFSLSQLSSNSSEESSIKSSNNFVIPLPSTPGSSDYTNMIGRPESPDLLKNIKRSKNPALNSANTDSKLLHPQPVALGNSPFARAPSPPVTKKLNKMNQRLMKPMKNVFDHGGSSSNKSFASNGKIKRHNISNPISVTANPPKWAMDWNGINANAAGKSFQPVINEEDEMDE